MNNAPVVIFGVESIFAVEIIETLLRLGRPIAATVIAGDPEWDMYGLSPVAAGALPQGILAHDAVVPWVTPGLKWQRARQAMAAGFSRFATLIDPAASLASSAGVGRGIFLNGGATIGAFARLGEFVVVNRNASVGHHSILGACVSVGPGATIAARCTIGIGTMIGSGATIAPGVGVGDNCLVAAGAVVTRDIAGRTLVAGNPARIVTSGYAGYKDVLVE